MAIATLRFFCQLCLQSCNHRGAFHLEIEVAFGGLKSVLILVCRRAPALWCLALPFGGLSLHFWQGCIIFQCIYKQTVTNELCSQYAILTTLST